MHEFFDAFVPEFRVGSDVHRIRVHDLDGKLLLGDFMNPIKERLVEADARSSSVEDQLQKCTRYWFATDNKTTSTLPALGCMNECKGHSSPPCCAQIDGKVKD